MVHTGLYFLRLDKTEYEVAHLFEHLVISKFDIILKEKGICPLTKGWVGGETFNDIIFIEYGLYDEDVKNLFEDYISSVGKYNKRDIPLEISRMSCESAAQLEITNSQDLDRMLHLLDSQIFTNINNLKHAEYTHERHINPDDKLIRPAANKMKYQEKRIGVAFKSGDINEIAAFFRLKPLIVDSIDSVIRKQGYYNYGDSNFGFNNENHTAYFDITIKTPVEIDHNNLKRLAQESIIMLQECIGQHGIDSYIEAFLGTPNWHYFPVEYYTDTGVLASKRLIADTLKETDNVNSILGRVKIFLET